jgi:hypothetical protein
VVTVGTLGSGQLLQIGRAASPQFVRPILFRLTGPAKPSIYYDGWVWLDGYQLDEAGDAFERRSLFVIAAGVKVLDLRAAVAFGPTAAPVVRQRRRAAA